RLLQTIPGLQCPGVRSPKVLLITLIWNVSLRTPSSKTLPTCRRTRLLRFTLTGKNMLGMTNLYKKGGAAGKSRKKPDYVDVTSDEEQQLKKVDDGKSSSDEDEGVMDTIPIPDSCPKYHLTRDIVGYLKSLSTLPSYQRLLAAVEKLPHISYSTTTKQQLPLWASWTWSQAYLPQAIHGNMETAVTALEDLSTYQFDSRGTGRIVILGLGLLLRECRRAQEHEADEASADVPNYLGNSILGVEVGDQIEEKIAGIEAVVEALLKDANVGLSVVRQDIDKRRAEERKKLKQGQTKKAEEASIADKKRRVEEEKHHKEEKRVEEEKGALEEKKRASEEKKRALEEKRMEEERLAEEASKA
ncbi:hypothetical protein BDR05DRAFT_954177, partial [Suillus weaverae]